jgi:hypothetical protein
VYENYAIVGANGESGGDGDPYTLSGAAYLFKRDEIGNWNEIEIIRASDTQSNDQFGQSVSISGDNAIVGAYYEAGGDGDPLLGSGAAYIYE